MLTPQLDDHVPDTAFVDETDQEKFSPIRSVFPPPMETVGAGFGAAVAGGAVVGAAVAGGAVVGGAVAGGRVVGAAVAGGTVVVGVGGAVVGGVGFWPEGAAVVLLAAATVVVGAASGAELLELVAAGF